MTLFDAARLSLRSGAGLPLARAHLRRPAAYQFVPLIMALRLSPVRLLIADNVGVGKTIETAIWMMALAAVIDIWGYSLLNRAYWTATDAMLIVCTDCPST